MSAVQLTLLTPGRGLVAGVDEAGRGPLAGPVVAGAVVLNPRRRIDGVRDSKIVPEEEREELAIKIRARSLAWAVAWADPGEIDALNILEATHLAMRRALAGLHVRLGHVQIDGNRCPHLSGLAFDFTMEPIIDGDALHANIGAASIIAKVTRDAMMRLHHVQYPGYGFASHKGYSTDEHWHALKRLGPTPIHRRSFEPVRLAWQRQTRRERRVARLQSSLASC
jgi:ribonuclease HII